eukprot:CAMPEP_0194216650 /NCGR_PEP_ID=MMETSP0156-20130528/19424_1 /TAXON_ID=33649 /ORGANISM="Thalassionema nitzschioides, Strain L26-B" /LENGTH=148 /DNA_ID=CAMNT_0038945471 /DNA_START=65 /DNA_END=511 /DNA_ORIENTATION=+
MRFFQDKKKEQFTRGSKTKSYEETMTELENMQIDIQDDISLESMEDVEFGDEPEASVHFSDEVQGAQSRKTNLRKLGFILLAAATVAIAAIAGVVVFSAENDSTSSQPLLRGPSQSLAQTDLNTRPSLVMVATVAPATASPAAPEDVV